MRWQQTVEAVREQQKEAVARVRIVENGEMKTPQAATVGLSEGLILKLEIAARAQSRSVADLLSEAVDLYLKDLEWHSLKAYGLQRAEERGIQENDVEHLIADVRSEYGR